jgi:Predicted Zn-dependent hydrolases of the beta-lactamase fold
MDILFVRHATILIYAENKKILVDPVFSDIGELPSIKSLRFDNKNPLIKLETSIDELIDVDSAFITHLHIDHFDTLARKLLKKSTKIFCQPQDSEIIKKMGFLDVSPIEQYIIWNNLKISRVDGKHGEGKVLEKMGKTSGFVLQDSTNYTMYITGDTIWYDGVKEAIEKFNPNAIVLNAGAATFPIGRPVTMNEADITSVIKSAPNSKIVAIHMDAWNHCMLSKENLHNFLSSKSIEKNVIIPDENMLIHL